MTAAAEPGSGFFFGVQLESGLRHSLDSGAAHMSHDSHPSSALFTQVDITAGAPVRPRDGHDSSEEQTGLLRSILAAQDRQNEILEELVNQMGAAQRQRNVELNQW